MTNLFATIMMIASIVIAMVNLYIFAFTRDLASGLWAVLGFVIANGIGSLMESRS